MPKAVYFRLSDLRASNTDCAAMCSIPCLTWRMMRASARAVAISTFCKRSASKVDPGILGACFLTLIMESVCAFARRKAGQF